VLDQLAQNQVGTELPTLYLDALRAQVDKTRRQTPLELESEGTCMFSRQVVKWPLSQINERRAGEGGNCICTGSDQNLRSMRLDTANIAGLSLYTDLVLHETVAQRDKPLASSAAHHPSSLATGRYNNNTALDLQRHAQLAAQQLATIRRWLDIFASVPPPLYWALPFTFWAHLAHVVIMLFRLAGAATSASSPKRPGSTMDVDVREVCARLAAGFAEASGARVQDDDDDDDYQGSGGNGRDDRDDQQQRQRQQGGGSSEPDFFMKCHIWMARLRDRWPGKEEDVNHTARGSGPQTGAVAAPEALYDFQSAQRVPRPSQAFTGFDFGDGVNMDLFGSSFFQNGDVWQGDMLSAVWDSQTPQFFS
jgi:hypothetical protein